MADHNDAYWFIDSYSLRNYWSNGITTTNKQMFASLTRTYSLLKSKSVETSVILTLLGYAPIPLSLSMDTEYFCDLGQYQFKSVWHYFDSHTYATVQFPHKNHKLFQLSCSDRHKMKRIERKTKPTQLRTPTNRIVNRKWMKTQSNSIRNVKRKQWKRPIKCVALCLNLHAHIRNGSALSLYRSRSNERRTTEYNTKQNDSLDANALTKQIVTVTTNYSMFPRICRWVFLLFHFFISFSVRLFLSFCAVESVDGDDYWFTAT